MHIRLFACAKQAFVFMILSVQFYVRSHNVCIVISFKPKSPFAQIMGT